MAEGGGHVARELLRSEPPQRRQPRQRRSPCPSSPTTVANFDWEKVMMHLLVCSLFSGTAALHHAADLLHHAAPSFIKAMVVRQRFLFSKRETYRLPPSIHYNSGFPYRWIADPRFSAALILRLFMLLQ